MGACEQARGWRKTSRMIVLVILMCTSLLGGCVAYNVRANYDAVARDLADDSICTCCAPVCNEHYYLIFLDTISLVKT